MYNIGTIRLEQRDGVSMVDLQAYTRIKDSVYSYSLLKH